jgi:hypothetical protein
MTEGFGQVIEIRSSSDPQKKGLRSAYIGCSPELIPSPGEYLMAAPVLGPVGEQAEMSVLADEVFLGPAPSGPGEDLPTGFWVSPPVPVTWLPGMQLYLRGPSGKGFCPPPEARHIALADAGGGAGALLALADLELRKNHSVVFFGDLGGFPELPAAIEVYPMDSLGDVRDWADYLAVDAPIHLMPELSAVLGVGKKTRPGLPIEVLVRGPMPCGGVGRCGVCAFQRGTEWLFACEDGPVIRYGASSS